MTDPADRPRPRRSALYMPGANARALEKARGLPADVLIFDLEDAVAPDAKDLARRQVAEALRVGGYGRREVAVRINGIGTPWHEGDLAMVRGSRPDAVVLPKVEDADAAGIEADGLPLWAMVETPRAILALPRIAAGAFPVLIAGTNDLAKDLRAPLVPGRAALQTALQSLVIAARAHGRTALDGVFNDIGDAEAMAAECAEGAALGFDGKTLIHPSQLAAANAAFAPDADAVRDARAVIAAFAAQPDAGVLKVNGRMTERLHLAEARRIDALAAAIAQSDQEIPS